MVHIKHDIDYANAPFAVIYEPVPLLGCVAQFVAAVATKAVDGKGGLGSTYWDGNGLRVVDICSNYNINYY
tara:strand:- start:39 stop:251 length:213 start_codon:yes stop_codon:yes gene_type:complete